MTGLKKGEFTRSGTLLTLLEEDLARELGAMTVACSQARKYRWLHVCGVAEPKVIKNWTTSPTPLGQLGLFSVTKERLQDLKEQQERQLALSVEMSRAGASGVAPIKKASDATTSQGSAVAKTTQAPKKKRKPKRRQNNKQASSAEPPAKTSQDGRREAAQQEMKAFGR